MHTLNKRRDTMATRSTIAIQHPNGTVSQIYCHWDGYPTWNGRLLSVYYSEYLKAKELLSHGDLSTLKSNINPTVNNHTFDTPQPEVCVYYGRDRGEPNTQARSFLSLDKYVQESEFEDYNYVLVDGVWYVNDCDNMDRAFHILTDVLDEAMTDIGDDNSLAEVYRNHRASVEVEVLPRPKAFNQLLLGSSSE